MTNIINTAKYGSIALAMVLFLAVPFAARAADDDTGIYTDSYTDSYPADYGNGGGTGIYTDSYTDSYPADYPEEYTSSGYTGSGYSTGGFTSGGSFIGSGTLGSVARYTSPSYLASQGVPSNTTIYAPTNTCTAVNSCNTDDHSIFNAPTTVTISNPPAVINNVVTNPAPQPYVNYNTPACNTCSCNSSYCQHYAYNNTPYVALSAVPYTGLDLGFWGTIAYWGFLVLWCLAAAYLVVVKKVQNRIFRSLGNFLFGSTTSVVARESVAPATMRPAYVAPAAPAVDEIDSFILSQVNRTR